MAENTPLPAVVLPKIFAAGVAGDALATPPKIFAADAVVCVAAPPPPKMLAAVWLAAGLPKIDAAEVGDENVFEAPNELPEKRLPLVFTFSATFGLQMEKSLKIEPTSAEAAGAVGGAVDAVVDGVPNPPKIEAALDAGVPEAKPKVDAGDAAAADGFAATIAGVGPVEVAVGVPKTLLENGDEVMLAAAELTVDAIPRPLKIDEVSEAAVAGAAVTGAAVTGAAVAGAAVAGAAVVGAAVVGGGLAVKAVPKMLAAGVVVVAAAKLKVVAGDDAVMAPGVVTGFAEAGGPKMLAGELALVAVAKLKVVTGDETVVVATAGADAFVSDTLARLIGADVVDGLDENTNPVAGVAIEATAVAGAGRETSDAFGVLGVFESSAFTMLGDAAAIEVLSVADAVDALPKMGVAFAAWPKIVSGFEDGAEMAGLLLLGVADVFGPKPSAEAPLSFGKFSLSTMADAAMTGFVIGDGTVSLTGLGGLLNENSGLSLLIASTLKPGAFFSAADGVVNVNEADGDLFKPKLADAVTTTGGTDLIETFEGVDVELSGFAPEFSVKV